MGNKKDIGKAFKEKLDGLQRSPNDAVWQSLRADLDKRKKQRRASFWLKALGIFAFLLITFSISYTIWGENSAPTIENNANDNTVLPSYNNTDSGYDTEHADKNSTGNSKNNNGNTTSGIVNDSNNENSSDFGGTTKKTKIDNLRNRNGKDADGSIDDVSEKSGIKKPGKVKNAGSVTNTNQKISNFTYSKHSAKANRKALRKSTKTLDNSIVDNQNSLDPNKKHYKRKAGKNSSKNVNQEENLNNRTASENNHQSINNSFTNAGSVVNGRDNTAGNNDSLTGNDSSTKTIGTIDLLTENDSINQTDSLKTVITVVEEEKKPEDNKKADSINSAGLKRWHTAINAGPLKYTFPSNKSIIDSRLDSNSVSVKSAFTYGAYIGYRFSPRWGVRLGIYSTKFEQFTKNAYLFNDMQQPENFDNITYAKNQGASALQGNEAISVLLGAFVDITVKTSYIEIPAEITFHAIGNKMGIDITAGISSLFINKNSVYASNGLGSIYMGTLNSKKMSFSTNLGLRLYYQFIPSLQLNIEPAFRYYLNTFDNVKPYSLSLQGGLQYNFDIGKKREIR